MKKKTATRTQIRAHHAPHFYVLFAFVMIVIGAFGAIIVTKVVGQTATQMIYACAQKSTGNLRMVAAGSSCRPDETSTSWNQQGPQGLQGEPGPQGQPGESGGAGVSTLPFTCGTCFLYPIGDRFKGKDLSYAQIWRTDLHGADLTGVIFKNAYLSNNNFTNTNLTGVDFTNVDSFAGAGSIGGNFSGANLTNANFTNANLAGARSMDSANTTGAIWSNTICPDGTNSNNNNNTCVGHF